MARVALLSWLACGEGEGSGRKGGGGRGGGGGGRLGGAPAGVGGGGFGAALPDWRASWTCCPSWPRKTETWRTWASAWTA